MQTALYARVSRVDKDQNPENQLLKLRSFAERHQWFVYREYVDYASGAKPSRPQFDDMLKGTQGLGNSTSSLPLG